MDGETIRHDGDGRGRNAILSANFGLGESGLRPLWLDQYFRVEDVGIAGIVESNGVAIFRGGQIGVGSAEEVFGLQVGAILTQEDGSGERGIGRSFEEEGGEVFVKHDDLMEVREGQLQDVCGWSFKAFQIVQKQIGKGKMCWRFLDYHSETHNTISSSS